MADPPAVPTAPAVLEASAVREARGPATPGSRLLGLDLLRALAVLGMLVAHVGPAAVTAEGVHWQWEVFHSRMPAMFAFAAGVSLTLASGGPRPPRDLRALRVITVVRALALSALGLALMSLGTPVVVILLYFGAYLVLVTPVLGWGARRLAVLAAVLTIVGPALSFLWRRHAPDGGLVRSLLVTGDYPALTWLPFVVAGMAIGRLDLGSRAVRARLAVTGTALTVLAYGGSALLLRAGPGDRLLADVGGDPALLRATLHAETGVTPTSDPAWLLTAAPHSGSWPDVVGCLGVSLLALAVLLPLGDRLGARASRPSAARSVCRALGAAAAAAGSMVLSVYVAHLLLMAGVTAVTGHDFGPAQPWWVLLAFTTGLAGAAWLWQTRFRRGPVESCLHRAAHATARALGARSVVSRA